MILSYHAAYWTSAAFCLIGMPVFILIFRVWFLSENYDFFIAFILSVLFFRGVGVVGHRVPKTTSAEEQEQEILPPNKDLSQK